MNRRWLVIALLLLLPVMAVAEETSYYTFGFNRGAGGFVRNQAGLAAATDSDTLTGPLVPCQGARRVQFRIKANSANTCSLAVIQVTMKDTTEAALQTHSLWVNANTISGLSVVDNLSNSAFADSLGGRTIELSAPGSSRIPWLFARAVIRMPCCGNAKADSVRFFCQVQRD